MHDRNLVALVGLDDGMSRRDVQYPADMCNDWKKKTKQLLKLMRIGAIVNRECDESLTLIGWNERTSSSSVKSNGGCLCGVAVQMVVIQRLPV